eukprot:570196-Hanusia_phi.AAC.1
MNISMMYLDWIRRGSGGLCRRVKRQDWNTTRFIECPLVGALLCKVDMNLLMTEIPMILNAGGIWYY